MSSKSLIHEFPGLPVDTAGVFRAYLLTSWTRRGIEAALQKVKEVDHRRMRIQHHCGVIGECRDCAKGSSMKDHFEWWSFLALMSRHSVERKRGERTTDRYGLVRHVWTENGLRDW